MIKENLFKEIYNRYGAVTRARNCFLYTKKGVRLTDLYQEDGRAILGWEGGNAFTHFKNILSRGQVGSFICEDHSRLEKAVSQLLASDRKIYFFTNKMDALKAGIKFSPYKTAVYKPWGGNFNKENQESQQSWADVDSVIITPPLPWTDTVYILALKGEPDFNIMKTVSLPFALQGALARSIYNLIEALQVRQEKDWFIYDPVLTKYWTRKGPYLEPKVPAEKYDDFVLHCLNLGIIINPECQTSIIPFGADKGVFTKLKNSPFVY